MKTYRRTPPKIAAEFIRAHLGRGAFAPLTGTDTRAWHAFVYLLELWGATRDPNVLDAMRATVRCAQTWHDDVMQLFVQTIPAVLDWCDVEKLWPTIAPPGAVYIQAIHGRDAL